MAQRLKLERRVFGRWKVISDAGSTKSGQSQWLCQCECGNKRVVLGMNLLTRKSQSCGCFQREVAGATLRRVVTKHGFTAIPEYSIYRAMIRRCYRANDTRFRVYGGRGITVCARWLNSFPLFLKDMGRRPTLDHTIERRDSNKGYSPKNCIWIPKFDQASNTSRNRRVTAYGKTLTLAQWERETGVCQKLIRTRIADLGWTAERAVSTPSRGIRKFKA